MQAMMVICTTLLIAQPGKLLMKDGLVFQANPAMYDLQWQQMNLIHLDT
jgi:hypothetical protein